MKICFMDNCIIANLSDENRFNLANATKIQNQLVTYVKKPNTHLVLDLNNIRFMDCKAVNSLLILDKVAKNNHSTVTLCNPSAHVLLLLDTLRLSTVLHIEEHVYV